MAVLSSLPAAMPESAAFPPLWLGPILLASFGVRRDATGSLLWHDVQQLRTQLELRNTGSKRWRAFKLSELDGVLELAEKSSRIRVIGGDLHGDLSLFVYLESPAPRWPHQGRLRITDHVILHVSYQSPWLMEAPPPWAPVGIMSPADIFLPNAAPQPRAALCLGALPAGVRVAELVQLAYLAVSTQTAMLDETEGVMNPIASEWFREHPQFLHLTRTGLLEPWSPGDLDLHDAIFEPEGGGL
jgi:hypothetical protein